MEVLNVDKLCVCYESFSLKKVSFSLKKGEIMGFIGRNGSGKSTTLKTVFNIINPDSGKVMFFGSNLLSNEQAFKQRVGFLEGGIGYFPNKTLKEITNVKRSFYDNWNQEIFDYYFTYFKLNENKSPNQLSEGMKVKYSLCLALSHGAEILILDEPTSGLDPTSREEVLDILIKLKAEGIAILFSTHIISDIEKCADSITYIKEGEILYSGNIPNIISKYKIFSIDSNKYKGENSEYELSKRAVGEKINILTTVKDSYNYYVDTKFLPEKIHLEELIVLLEKGKLDD